MLYMLRCIEEKKCGMRGLQNWAENDLSELSFICHRKTMMLFIILFLPPTLRVKIPDGSRAIPDGSRAKKNAVFVVNGDAILLLPQLRNKLPTLICWQRTHSFARCRKHNEKWSGFVTIVQIESPPLTQLVWGVTSFFSTFSCLWVLYKLWVHFVQNQDSH